MKSNRDSFIGAAFSSDLTHYVGKVLEGLEWHSGGFNILRSKSVVGSCLYEMRSAVLTLR